MAGTHTSPTQGTSPLDHTRQMLDELDSLMERMMALPVSDLESSPIMDENLPVPTVSATVTLFDSPSAADALEATAQVNIGLEAESEDQAPLLIPTGAFQTTSELDGGEHWLAYTHTEEDSQNPSQGLLPDELMLPSVLTMATPPIDPLSMPNWGVWSLCLQPLHWTNRGFDRCADMLGPIGQWLRHPVGRNLLGILGIGFLGLALAWVIKDWLGWTW